MKKWLCYLLLSIATLGLAKGATFLRDYSTNDVLITAGFIPDSSRIIVGEPLFLTFVVSNRAEVPFQFCRVGTEIFSFAATNASGKPARNPWLHMMDGNGFVSSVKVDSGKPFTSRLFLNGWCEFDEPGDYTVTCRCKFGRCFTRTNSFDSLEQPIVTVFKLTVLPSNPERITEIINEWGQVVETNGSLDEAAQALAEFNDPRIIPPLAVLVEKDANNYFAVNALARFTNDAAVDALAVVLKSGNYEAGVAKTAIAKAHQTDRIARSFLPGLTNAEANVRIQNAGALSWTGSELAFAPLCALLQDETNTVRYAAAEAVGKLGDARSFVVLTNLLNDSDFYLRLAAVKGLIALKHPFQANWLTPIICAARNNDEAHFRTYIDAVELMSLSGGDQAAPGLVSCLDFNNPSGKDWYNFYLLQYIGANWEPKYYHYYKWHQDTSRDGTEAELAENHQILAELKAWLEKHKPNSE
jgi:hypothetical protein